MLGLNLASCGLIFETRKYPDNFQTGAQLSTLNTSYRELKCFILSMYSQSITQTLVKVKCTYVLMLSL